LGEKLPPQELELYKRCDEVLHYLWDPIGVAGAPGARDEYRSYLPNVFALVQAMGLRARPERARQVAEVLRDWRKWIWENTA
jgi:hypothetical protein